MRRTTTVLVLAGFIAAACGGGTTPSGAIQSASTEAGPSIPATTTDAASSQPSSSPAPTSSPAAPTTLPSETTTTTTIPTAAASLGDVRKAVVRIAGTGTFSDPYGGAQANVPGAGSGFIIDPSGLAVTNTHVAVGATALEVYVGDEAAPRAASVVAMSECSDLAVIDIDGDGFGFLEWSDQPVAAGLEVFASGFPLDGGAYAALQGTVAGTGAAGETAWVSVDALIAHDIATPPGHSGGPLVTAEGKVVGVNYAGSSFGQSVAIGADVARPAIETLRSGTDLTSIGVNGVGFAGGDGNGIWVYSVEPGSPAGAAGLLPGDLITTLENVALAADGTVASYCDVLEKNQPTDVLPIQVYRRSTDQLFAGEINGWALSVQRSFAVEFDEVVTDDPGGFEYGEYALITDDSMLIEVSVPAGWADIRGDPWSSELAGPEDLIGPALSASPDLIAFNETWSTPGMFIGASSLISTSVEETIDVYWFSGDCTYDARYPYDDGLHTGLYDVYTDCGGLDTVLFQAVVEPADQTWIASVQIVAVTVADLTAADEVLASFVIQPLGG